MKNIVVTCPAERLKRLPRRHRIAHLRALIELEPAGCGRRDELSAMLRREIPDGPVE
jgi:hypothetical protein